MTTVNHEHILTRFDTSPYFRSAFVGADISKTITLQEAAQARVEGFQVLDVIPDVSVTAQQGISRFKGQPASVTIEALLSGSVNSVSDTLEFQRSNENDNISDWQTPIVTYGGFIYYAYVNTSHKTIVCRMPTTGGSVEETIVDTEYNTPENAFHTCPSIGVDTDGFIHVAYRMHNSPYTSTSPWGTGDNITNAWQYEVSAFPDDISDFERRWNTNPPSPNGWITYPRFWHSRNGTLFITNRQRVKFSDGWSPGTQAAGLSRYDTATKTWTVIGATVADGYPAFIYEPNGGENGGGYQPHRPFVYFDKNNRMHVADIFTSDTTDRGERCIYAYSDDEGDTWYDAAGNGPLTLPLRHDSSAAIEVNFEADGGMYTLCHVAIDKLGRPIVAYEENHDEAGEDRVYRRWNGSSWDAPVSIPGNFPARLFSDDAGVLYCHDSSTLYVSEDNGSTWESYSIHGGANVQTWLPDWRYLNETGHIRYQHISSSNTVAQVRTITVNRG